MASIYRHKSGKWVAAVRRKGLPTRTKTFPRHTDAKRWAAEQEAQAVEILTYPRKTSWALRISCNQERPHELLVKATP